jgi:hypothetical protein
MITKERLWWAMQRACVRAGKVPPNPRVREFLLPVIMTALEEGDDMATDQPRLPVTRDLADFLVTSPVEAQGILSRIETHIVQMRDQHTQTANDVLAIKVLLRAITDRLAKMEGSHAKGRQQSGPG